MEFIRQHQQSLMLIMIGICLLISFLVLITKNLSKARKQTLFLLEISSAFLLTVVRLSYIYRGVPGEFVYVLLRITKFLDYLFSGFIIFIVNQYLKDLFLHEGGMTKVPVLLYVCDIFFIVEVCSLIAADFFGFYYTIDSANNFVRQNGRLFAYAYPFISLLLQLFCMIRYRKKIPWRNSLPIILFIVLPMSMTVLQFIVSGIAFGAISTVGMAIILYVFEIQNLNSAVERAHRLEIEMLERYKKDLEETVEKRTHELRVANEKAEHLLLNILPEDIAKELTEHPNQTISRKYPNATVLFTDIVGFTKMSGGMTADQTVVMLNRMVSLFDERAKREGVEKIKTIGDAYMAATGLSENSDSSEVTKMVRFAVGLLEDVKKFDSMFSAQVQIRIGINCGELVAGVIGKTKFIYDIWGDTVNVASRMESTGEPMRIHVSEEVYNQTKNDFPYKGPIPVEVKGKGTMNGYFLQ